MDNSQLVGNIIAFLAILLPLIWQAYKWKKERDDAVEKNKNSRLEIEVYNNLLTIQGINEVSRAVSEMFKLTIADRFLILIALEINNKIYNVSVIFEQHKNENYRINAIARYKNVKIDSAYRELVRETELKGLVELEVSTMRDSILKFFYQEEGITFSKIRFINRKFIEKNKDVVCFSSVSTHENRPFDNREKMIIKTQYDNCIIPLVKKILGEEVDFEHVLLN